MAECGIASLAMIAAYHGHKVDLNGLRQRFALSLKGSTLSHLIVIAGSLHLTCRPLRLELEQLGQLALPCILHWDLNHFVVLKSVHREGAVIHDPAFGARRLSRQQVSRHFSGVALEVAPTADFQPQTLRTSARLSDLWSRVLGWKRALAQTVLLSVLLQLFALAAPSYLQLVIDEAVSSFDTQFLLVLAAAFASMYVVQTATQALRSWVILQIGQAMSFQMVGNVLHHLLRLPSSFFEKRIVGDILSRMGSIRPIQEALTQSVVTALIDGVMAVAIAALLFAYSPFICSIVLGTVLLYFGVVLVLYPYRRYREEELLVANAESQTYLIESIRASKTVKLFGREAVREVVWRNYFVNVLNASMGIGKLEIANQSARTLMFGLQIVLVVYFSATLVMRSEFTLGMLFAVLLYRDSFAARAEALAQRVIEFRLLKLHLERLADVVQTEREPGLDMSRAEGASVTGSLVLRDVSFRYAQNEPLIFEDVSLDVQPGQFIAIVGVSGGGKTTLLKVMLGLLLPTSGEILVEGLALQSFGVQQWRRSIGVVQQDDELLMGTIADNICFFDADLDMKRVVESAKAAAVHDEIQAMPMGYLSLVGDMGSTLSGGQRQRVLLARALYVQPKILFLDEGTANLDPSAEMRIADLIESMPITRVIVAHRPELIARAHKVWELRGGRLRELAPMVTPTDAALGAA
jgi:ATP-binding cassette, subfamily B, bacterial CvaB/MchF/RaxB